MTKTYTSTPNKSTYHELNFGHGETIDMLRQSVNAFAAQEIVPIADQTDKENAFPNQLWKKFGDMGLLGMTAVSYTHLTLPTIYSV